MEVDKGLQEKYSDQYLNNLDEWRLIGGKGKANNIIDISRKLDFETVIDVGSGDGSVLYHLDRMSFCDHITSLEISRSGLEKIKSRDLKSVKEFKLFDGYKIPYENDKFDLALCSHVIEHVEYPRALIREIARVSKHQIFEIPIDFSLNVDKKVSHFLSYGHINIYTPQTFRFLLKSEGLNTICYKNLMYEKEVFDFINKNKSLFQKLKTKTKNSFRNKIKFLMEIKPNVTIVLTTKSKKGIQIIENK